jgi:hypothetical protein
MDQALSRTAKDGDGALSGPQVLILGGQQNTSLSWSKLVKMVLVWIVTLISLLLVPR